MSSLTTGAIVFGCIFGARLLGVVLRAFLPEKHLSAESKDLVKLGMGLQVRAGPKRRGRLAIWCCVLRSVCP